MIFLILLFLSAFFISSVAAWFSIAGLVTIFPGAKLAVILMGSSLDFANLISASWLYRFWDKAHRLMKTYFISAVCILSIITSMGVFGYLTKSHIEGAENLDANTEQLSLLDSQILIERENITASRAALQQMDAAVNNLVGDVTRIERAVQIRNSQRRERSALTTTISESNQKIQAVQQQKSLLNVGQRKLETEIGPIKYIAQLIYGQDNTETIEKSVRLLTILVILVFDPLAILLVVAANMQLQQLNKPTLKESTLPPTKNLAQTLQDQGKKIYVDSNVTKMETDWNPGSWFKIVKDSRPK